MSIASATIAQQMGQRHLLATIFTSMSTRIFGLMAYSPDRDRPQTQGVAVMRFALRYDRRSRIYRFILGALESPQMSAAGYR